MNKVMVLAKSLNSQMVMDQKAKQIVELVLADDASNGIKVLRHGDGARLVNQLFQDYISDRDYTSYLEFYKDVDALLYKYRGNQGLDLSDLEEEDDDTPRGKGRRGKKSFAVKKPPRVPKGNAANPPDDEPLPEENSVVMSSDIKELLRRNARKTINERYNA